MDETGYTASSTVVVPTEGAARAGRRGPARRHRAARIAPTPGRRRRGSPRRHGRAPRAPSEPCVVTRFAIPLCAVPLCAVPLCAIPLGGGPGSCSAGRAPARSWCGHWSRPQPRRQPRSRDRHPRAGAVGTRQRTGVPPRPFGGRRPPARTPACRPGRRPAARDRALARGSGLVVPRPVPRCRVDRGRRRPPRHERHGRPCSGCPAAPDARGCLDGRADRYGCRHRGRRHHRGAVAVPAVRPSRRPRVVRTAACPTSHTRSVPNPQRATLNRDRTRPCCLLPRHRPA
ncbi:hypothetical protein J2Y89_000930 [Curtobacterium herbarum]|nr:hypothetical protein [Curtobacterium herbarum]